MEHGPGNPGGQARGGRGRRALRGIGALAGLALAVYAVLYLKAPPPGDTPPAGTGGGQPAPPAAEAPPGPPADKPPLLEIGAGDWSWERSGDVAVVSGRVRNVSGGPLTNVVAEASFFGGDGRFITSAEAFIFPKEIPPGQTVTFEVREAWDPAFKDARVSFQELYGYRIETRWRQP